MKTFLTIIIFIIFGFMYVEIESMIENKEGLTFTFALWCLLLWGVAYIRFRKLIND